MPLCRALRSVESVFALATPVALFLINGRRDIYYLRRRSTRGNFLRVMSDIFPIIEIALRHLLRKRYP